MHRRFYWTPGPNYIWHIDAYDKIKPYGFGISGCIDGFSRRLIWLKVYTTNSDPSIIAGYFLEALKEHRGCPCVVRADAGTENVRVRDIQESLAGNNNNRNAYIQGPSTGNQRIESFWSQLRKQCMEYWICLLSELQDNGYFAGDFIDLNLIHFCFLGIIQVIYERSLLFVASKFIN